MGWRIVYIEESEYLSLYLDNIKIKRNDNDVTIPLSDIHSLIIDNYKSMLSVNLLNKCSEEKINVVLCGIDHMPKTIITPVSGNNQSPKMLQTQISWGEKIKEEIQRIIIVGKIENQNQVLEKHHKNPDVIKKIEFFKNETLPGDPGNREGLSAKMYFRELFGDDFTRFDDDSINSGLNYGYEILRSQISKVLISRGLNPAIGIFHRGAENCFNLSDDIIEVFRPIIDDYVFQHLSKKDLFTREHRLSLIKLTTKSMLYSKERQTLFNVINLYVNSILDCLNFGVLKEIEIPRFKDFLI